jgi:adenosylcobinamide-phosphate synthase
LAAGIVAGVAFDALLADPRRGHPVALFGHGAAVLERRLYADAHRRGVVFTTCCVAGAVGLGVAAQRAVRGRCHDAEWLLIGGVVWTVVGATSLVREAGAVAGLLEAEDIAAARVRLSHLCARDSGALDEKALTRATVESVAENTCDAMVAPLFWGVVAGVPGLLGYRTVNTLDAMVGYHSARYERFGWAAARLDDVVNWVPARLTALLTVALAPAAGGSPAEAWRILRRDGARHPSPNAGRCEAAVAGALGVALGGTNDYGGRTEHRPRLGNGRTPEVSDVARSVRLSRTVGLAAAVLAAGTALWLDKRRTGRSGPALPGGRP